MGPAVVNRTPDRTLLPSGSDVAPPTREKGNLGQTGLDGIGINGDQRGEQEVPGTEAGTNWKQDFPGRPQSVRVGGGEQPRRRVSDFSVTIERDEERRAFCMNLSRTEPDGGSGVRGQGSGTN